MNLDAADLAILEVDIEHIEPLGREIAQLLIKRIRDDEENVERAQLAATRAQDHAKDAKIALDHLREYIKEAPINADERADEIEKELDAILELDL